MQTTPLRPPVTPAQQQVSAAAVPKKNCTADFEKDGSLTVTFSVSPEMAKRFVRNANTQSLADYIWLNRGLRHFEHQPLI